MRFVKAHFFWRAIFVIACMGALSNFSSADVIKLYEVTNNKQTPAGDARLTFNVNPTSGASDVFGPGTVNGNMITFMGGPLAPGASTKIAAAVPQNATVTKYELSYPGTGELAQVLPLVGFQTGEMSSGGTLMGFVSVTNFDPYALSFSNFVAAVNIPSGYFGSSQMQLQGAIANNLYLADGTPIGVPSSFQLQPGQNLFLDLGPVVAGEYVGAEANVAFSDPSLPPSALTTLGAASNTIVPEPSSVCFFLVDCFGILLVGWRRHLLGP